MTKRAHSRYSINIGWTKNEDHFGFNIPRLWFPMPQRLQAEVLETFLEFPFYVGSQSSFLCSEIWDQWTALLGALRPPNCLPVRWPQHPATPGPPQRRRSHLLLPLTQESSREMVLLTSLSNCSMWPSSARHLSEIQGFPARLSQSAIEHVANIKSKKTKFPVLLWQRQTINKHAKKTSNTLWAGGECCEARVLL